MPKPNYELFRKSLIYSGAAIWNSLPLHVRTIELVVIDLINANFRSFILPAWFGIDVIVSVYYSLSWHATTLVSFIYTWSLLPTKLYWLLYSDRFTSYLIRAFIPYHSHLFLLLNHVVIVVKLCCVETMHCMYKSE